MQAGTTWYARVDVPQRGFSHSLVAAPVAGASVMKLPHLRLSLATLTGMVVALALLDGALDRTRIGAQTESRTRDPQPPPRRVELELLGRLEDGSGPGPLGLVVAGDLVYLAAWRHGLRIARVANANDPVEVGSCPIRGRAKDVAVAGGYTYVAALESGLRVLDVADPRNPAEVGSYPTQGSADAVAIAGK